MASFEKVMPPLPGARKELERIFCRGTLKLGVIKEDNGAAKIEEEGKCLAVFFVNIHEGRRVHAHVHWDYPKGFVILISRWTFNET